MLDRVVNFVYEELAGRGLVERLMSRQTAKRLAGGEDFEVYRRQKVGEIIKKLVIILLVTGGLGLVAWLASEASPLEANRLKRPAAGRGAASYELRAKTQEGDLNLSVMVDEQKVGEDELEDYFEEAFSYISQVVKGDNPDLDRVSESLFLATGIPGKPIKVSWLGLDTRYIYQDGSLRYENIDREIITELGVSLTYFDEERIYYFPLRLVPRP